ncbi:Sperm-specific class P protein 31 [Toxocara canis]|uniref:Major sperm protein n=1 Tax=Toxocara canis TaxID=6265 RepID=A0A0B2VJ21_TOXCA|nr:Sperm-specific class P protein 31 [Toxocara canis]
MEMAAIPNGTSESERIAAGVSSRENTSLRNNILGESRIDAAAFSPNTATITIRRNDLCYCRTRNGSSRHRLKKSSATIRVPRMVLEARSPGSKPNFLLVQLEAIKNKNEKMKGRSPGAAVPLPKPKESKGPLEKEKNSPTSSETKIDERVKNNPEPVKLPDSPQFKSAILPLLPPTSLGGALSTLTARASQIMCKHTEQPDTKKSAESTKTNDAKKPNQKGTRNNGLTVEPMEAEFSVEGGMCTLMLLNESNVRFAIKIKTSNNQFFRVNPVYSFLDSGTMNELEIFRLPGGSARIDKLLLCYVIAKEEDTNAKALFDLRAKIQNLYIFRLPGGSARIDKLLLCYVIAKEEDTNAKALFDLRAKIQNLYVKLKTV